MIFKFRASLLTFFLCLPTHAFEWQTESPAQLGFDEAKLNKAAKLAFPGDALLIITQGKIIFEKYSNGYTRESRHRLWSITKSFLGTLIGFAEQEGMLNRLDPVSKYLSDFKTPAKEKITLEHLLEMTSGLTWNESYLDLIRSDVIAMLYGPGQSDMGAFAAGLPPYEPPGTGRRYSSGTSNLLSLVLKKALGSRYDEFPWKSLFDPLGMESPVWEIDGAGTYVGSSYLYMSARDLARFGLFLIKQGAWENQPLLKSEWIDYSTALVPAFSSAKPKKRDSHPGRHFWSNLPIPGAPDSKPWPDAPDATFVSLGHSGQHLFFIPEQDLVIVRFADEGGETSMDRNAFLKLVLESLERSP